MAPTHLPFIITLVGVLSHVWSLLLHQATSQLPGRPQSALLPVPVCHWRHTTLRSDSHTSCQNPTQCEPAHPEFSADLIRFIRHGSEILSTTENPFQAKEVLPPSEQLPAITRLFPELDAWQGQWLECETESILWHTKSHLDLAISKSFEYIWRNHSSDGRSS